MVESKGWDWENAGHDRWLKPTEDAYALAAQWKEQGVRKILDLGSGLGRHSIYFAKQGFEVSAMDISDYGVGYLKDWAKKEGLSIDAKTGDMLSLPYPDSAFDAVFAYHVISHTDTEGVRKIISEIKRVLCPGGMVFLSLCAKDTPAFASSGWPKLDENTVVCKDEGPDYNVPHFHAGLEDIRELFAGFDIIKVRHINYCIDRGEIQDNRHYYVYASLKEREE